MKPKRAKGVIVTESVEPAWGLAEEAKTIQRQKKEASAARAERRANAPVPNWKCYPMVFKVGVNIDANGQWLGGRLPKCRVCEANLPPGEHHNCEGFTPKYVEHTQERRDRMDQRREEIRQQKLDEHMEYPVCSVCGEEMPDYFTDGQWHWDMHEGRPVKNHFALDGEPDGDLDGYDDEPEDDYCEGDDDGWDCD